MAWPGYYDIKICYRKARSRTNPEGLNTDHNKYKFAIHINIIHRVDKNLARINIKSHIITLINILLEQSQQCCRILLK